MNDASSELVFADQNAPQTDGLVPEKDKGINWPALSGPIQKKLLEYSEKVYW